MKLLTFPMKLEIVYCYHYRINNNNYFKGITNPQCEESLFKFYHNPQNIASSLPIPKPLLIINVVNI